MTHLLTYYRWNTRRSWRLDGLRGLTNDSPTIRYIFRDVGAWKKYAKKDTILWVLGLSRKGHPTLDACIQIDGVYFRYRKGKRWRGIRGHYPASRYFGLNDAAEAMAQIAFTNSKCKPWRLKSTESGRTWQSQHGGRLQNPLRIATAGEEIAGQRPSLGAAPLDRLAEASIRKSIFVSYKHDDLDDRDSRGFLDQLAIELARNGVAVWLDRVALAGTGGRKFPQESDQELEELLAQGLDQCRIVLGVWRDLYGTPSVIDGVNWTQQEWTGSRHNTERVALDPRHRYKEREGLQEPSARLLLPANPRPSDAQRVADRIVRKCRKLWS